MNRRNFIRRSATVGAAVVVVKALPRGAEVKDIETLIAEIPEPDYTEATSLGMSSFMFTAAMAPRKYRG